MSKPMKVLVPQGWTPETVVAIAGPVPIGEAVPVGLRTVRGGF